MLTCCSTTLLSGHSMHGLFTSLEQSGMLQAVEYRAGMLMYLALTALRRHATRSQLARSAILRVMHKQMASAWVVWTAIVQACINNTL